MTPQELELFKLMQVFFNDAIVYVLLIFVSLLALTLSVYTSAKARNVSNPVLYAAITFTGGAIAAIIYACTKKGLTRTDNVKKSWSVFWLVFSCVLAVCAVVMYVQSITSFVASVNAMATA